MKQSSQTKMKQQQVQMIASIYFTGFCFLCKLIRNELFRQQLGMNYMNSIDSLVKITVPCLWIGGGGGVLLTLWVCLFEVGQRDGSIRIDGTCWFCFRFDRNTVCGGFGFYHMWFSLFKFCFYVLSFVLLFM